MATMSERTTTPGGPARGTPEGFTPRRPDASMSLLNDLLHEPGDAEYVVAARRRRMTGAAPPRRRPWVAAGVLVTVGVLLAAGVLEARSQADTIDRDRAGLAARIRAETSMTDSLERQAGDLDAQVSRLRAALTSHGGGGVDAGRLATLGGATGTLPVAGPGLRVTLSDATEQPVQTTGCEYGRILDVDVQRLVNGLWAAGAEAVSVGGQRLTALTAIRSANDTILVGYRPIAAPYEVLAVGDPRTLEARLASGEAGDWFSSLVDLCGVGYTVETLDEVRLPGAPGTDIRYAEPVAAAGPAADADGHS